MWRASLGFAVALGAGLGACGGSPNASGAGGLSGSSASSGEAATTASSAASSGASIGASSSGAGGGGGALGPVGNAVQLVDGSIVPLYPVTGSAVPARAIGFFQSGSTVTAVSETGATLWTKDEGAGELFGGFDLDGDGVIDLGLVRRSPAGQDCGGQPMIDTAIDVAFGASGQSLALVPAMPAICWTFGQTTYPTEQWTNLGVLFGASPGKVAVMAYYATSGSFFSYAKGALNDDADLDYPSTVAFDAYAAAKPNAHGAGHAYEQYSHVANGLTLEVNGEERLLIFTTARVAQYVVGPHGATQLALDTPFLTAGRTDLVGRDYGLVEADPGDPTHVVLVSGTSIYSLFQDQTTGKMASDPWGQIERHVTRYDVASGAVEDRFFSYAHDNNDGNKYEGRVAYPNEPFVRLGAGQPSHLAFDVYEGGHWQLHVTAPGSTADALVLHDQVLWDIRDLDGDGIDEWVMSPVKDPSDPDVPGYYFPKWRTVIAHWNEATQGLDVLATHQDVIPYLQATFRLPKKTTSFSHLYPSLTVAEAGALKLLVVDASAKISREALP